MSAPDGREFAHNGTTVTPYLCRNAKLSYPKLVRTTLGMHDPHVPLVTPSLIVLVALEIKEKYKMEVFMSAMT